MKYLNMILATVLVSIVAVSAAQKVTFSDREVRDPKQLAPALAANAADAETRIAAVEAVGATTTTVAKAASALQPNAVTVTNVIVGVGDITNTIVVIGGQVISWTVEP